jgi:anthranilate phosphoribosyltransferase
MSGFDAVFKKVLDGGRLDFQEARLAMTEIMSGAVTPVRLAALLGALKVRGETSSELAGFASAMRDSAVSVKLPRPDAVDIVGTGGDCAKTINVSTAAAFVAAGAGATVAKHGNRAVSSASGSADVLEALGVNISLSPEQAEECLKSAGIAFLFAQLMHPAMRHAAPVRKELGIRTVFNMLGPLCNPAGVKRYVLGVSGEKNAELVAGAALELKFERSFITCGLDGLDELTVSGPSRVFELKNGSLSEYEITPEDAGLRRWPKEAVTGGTPAENAAVIKGILSGGIRDARRDIVTLNAAAALLAAGLADSWPAAAENAARSIDSGAAAKKLKELSELSRRS